MVPQQPPITPITPITPRSRRAAKAVKEAKEAKEAVLLTFPGVAGVPGARCVAPDPVLALIETTAAQQEHAGDYLAAVALRSAAARIASLTWRLDKLQRQIGMKGGRA